MKLTVSKNQNLVQILSIFSASVAGIGYGMHYSWTSPSIPALMSDSSKNISLEEASYLLIFQAIAMGITAPLFSVIIDKAGRKLGVLLVAVPQIIAWIIIAFAQDLWLFYLAKFIVGIGDSAIYTSVFVYICEITEPKVRHGWTNIAIIAMYLGIFLVNLIGAVLDVSKTALVCLVFSTLHLLSVSWVPESPYYLIAKNRFEDAKASLRKLRMRYDVDAEFAMLREDVARQQSESGTWRDLFRIASNRRALLIVIGLRLIQQCSGFTVFEVYAQYTFQAANVSLSASTSAVAFTGISLVSGSLCMYTVHKFGRKPLLLYSCLGCGLCLLTEGIYYSVKHFTSLDTSSLYWFPLCGMIVYVTFSALGLATLPSIVSGEVCSTSIKGKIMIVNNLAFAISFLVLPKVFQMLTEGLGIYAPFYLFSFFCFIGAVFIYFFVVETKGKTLEQIQQELKGNHANKPNLTKKIVF